MMYTCPTQQSGFSLVETLVAITLLLIVIVGPMTISSSTARSTSFASEQVVAFFLAQEGAEIAQRARDDFLLQELNNDISTPWTDFTDPSGPYAACFSSECGLELQPDGSVATPVACSDTSNPCRLYYDESTTDRNKYTHNSTGASSTPFTREITLRNTADHEVAVESRVYWRSGNQRQVQEVIVETSLFDVYGN